MDSGIMYLIQLFEYEEIYNFIYYYHINFWNQIIFIKFLKQKLRKKN